MHVQVTVAHEGHCQLAPAISQMIADAAQKRGTGIARRSQEYLAQKMAEGKAVIALDGHTVVGFCYIESWQSHQYVAHSGLIVAPQYQNTGLARRLKARVFQLSAERFPQARVFGITTSLAVMKINSDLGYKPVTFAELTTDEDFWRGCCSCPNFDILQRTERRMCLCTGMLYDPANQPTPAEKRHNWRRFLRFLIKHRRPLLNRIRTKS